MGTYIGIDLGTTNSAICSYNGKDITVYKSPEGSLITPSAIYFEENSRFYGERAYKMAAFAPDKTLTLFKRMMGTNTPMYVPAYDIKMTPEECSAEVLRVLYNYLPDSIKNDPDTGTVVTIPASFNQMQRDATLTAVEMSGIGKVSLMQEPVAAIMSIMFNNKLDGMFLVYDLGGGTFDVALAESIKGRVSLIEHGGIVMCGGRDWDRTIVDLVIIPWLNKNFNLSADFASSPINKTFFRIATWAAEKAKKELSKSEYAKIIITEEEARLRDETGKSIYIDCTLDRSNLNSIIKPRVDDTIDEVFKTIKSANIEVTDISKIVFVGGPSYYAPLRDMVCEAIGVECETSVDPMLAVAQGAALFAESIDWSTQTKQKKISKKTFSLADISFDYLSRTSDIKSRILVRCEGKKYDGFTWQIDSRDTGWTSGRILLVNGTSIEVFLNQKGDNRYAISVFDEKGSQVSIPNNEIVITQTATTVDAIPTSNSLCVEVLEKIGGTNTVPKYLVKKGESLPKKGKISFKAMESLKAGAVQSLNFNLYEGEIEEPVSDNNFVGTFKISGSDFDAGIIQKGDELICEYEIADSGNIFMTVSVSSIGASFASHNLYSRQEGQIDFTTAELRLKDEISMIMNRINSLNERIFIESLEGVKQKLLNAQTMLETAKDPETSKLASEMILNAKKMLSYIKKENLFDIRKADIDNLMNFYNKYISPLAKPSEIDSFNYYYNLAVKSLSKSTTDFETIVNQLIDLNLKVLWRQDWFISETFDKYSKQEHLFTDKLAFKILVDKGVTALEKNNYDELRKIVLQMFRIKIWTSIDRELFSVVNIM